MDSLSISLELAAIRDRTQKITVVSLAAHLLAGFLILSLPAAEIVDTEPEYELTEITWVDTEEIIVATAPPAPPPDRIQVVEAVTEKRPAPPEPKPAVRSDQLQKRLAALRGELARTRPALTQAIPDPGLQDRPRAMTGTIVSGAGVAPTALKRSGPKVTTAVPAARTLKRQAVSVTVAAAEPAARPDREETGQPAADETIVPGITLAGPVTDRALLDYTTPSYPEWAKQDGVEVSVELLFTVLPNGSIKEDILVEKTSGIRDFDERAMSALIAWRFESLGGGATAEQWGRIKFNYRLRDAG